MASTPNPVAYRLCLLRCSHDKNAYTDIFYGRSIAKLDADAFEFQASVRRVFKPLSNPPCCDGLCQRCLGNPILVYLLEEYVAKVRLAVGDFISLHDLADAWLATFSGDLLRDLLFIHRRRGCTALF